MANRLQHAQSPYLQQHAENPVDWQEWDEAAFAQARAENKPIFLSIGYSTCHWCHVMAHESFEDEDIAALLNADFIAIKVDREERPDVDQVYMTYVQALTGHGGWPLSVWLTPDRKPFYGGTYFPPADRGGRAGFPSLLRAIAGAWKDPAQRAQLIAEGDRVIAALQPATPSTPPAADSAEALLEAAQGAFERGYQYFSESFDAQVGGFGGAPKFPRASVLSFLIRCARLQGPGSAEGDEALRMVTTTLRGMARGGIHDHVGGGFHRYSVDARWFCPHFEKMLYDQAQITVNCLEAYGATNDERYAWLTRDILDYALRDLRQPGGGFASAEDADSQRAGSQEHAEGAFYVWTAEELADVLTAEDAALATAHFGVRAQGNVPPELDPQGELAGRNILAQMQSLAATAKTAQLTVEEANDRLLTLLERLRDARARRPRPHLDHKIITAWNGLMISALARAHLALEAGREGPTPYRDAAEAAARFIQRELVHPTTGRLHRAFGTSRGTAEAFAEDYACLIDGLLDLYEATLALPWLRWADALQTELDARFWDEAGGGYFSAPGDDPHLILRLKEDYDGAEPAPSSVAARTALRLADYLHDESRRERARRTLAAFAPRWTEYPQALPAMLVAIDQALSRPRQVVIAGAATAPETAALVATARTAPGRARTILALTGHADDAWLAERAPWMAGMRTDSGRATAYVCDDFACRAPVTNPAALAALLAD
jgi:uncharacterized protein YyaL (SSP411 family)